MSFNYIENVGKYLCVGRNYMDQIKELDNPKPSEPFFFLKPDTSVLLPNQGPILVPGGATVHHEIELAIVIGKKLSNLDPETFGAKEALDVIEGYSLAIDLTARNVQALAKKKSLPWTTAKGFDTFLPISAFITKEQIKDPYNVELNLKVNEEHRHQDLTNLMIFPIHELLVNFSSIMTLNPGDVILTGTPKGVNTIVPGDKVEAWCSYNGEVIKESHMTFDVAARPGPYSFKGE